MKERLSLCDVCKMHKQQVISVGVDGGNGYRNRNVCSECLPMVLKVKKEKRDEAG